MLKNFPEEVINLWNNGEIRGMVLLSLLLQTILIVFGSRRKTAARIWIRILVWSAYLLADSVATFALGNLARSQRDSSGDSSEKANNSIQAFWAPFYAFLCLVFSDWTLIWLEDEGWNAQNSAIYSLIRTLTRSKRWSRSIAQHDLISCCIENRSLRCLKSLGINEKMRQMFVHRVDMKDDLQRFIFGHLQNKAEKMKEDFDLIDKNLRSKIIGQRGDGVLERAGRLRDYKWCTTEVEFSRSILVWHLATEICYVKDASNVSKEYETSRCLSEYMVYLLVMRPNMLSKGIGDEGYLDTLQDLQRLNPHNTKGDEAKKGVVDGILRSELSLDDITFQSLWKIAKSVVIGGEKLANQLLRLESKKRWEMINEVWVEMVVYAAAHCPWKEHTQQLRRGGELLTHVSLLMLHLGLSEQYEFTRFDGDEVSVLDFFSSDRSRKYQSAVEKYAKGIVDMSMSKPVEALYRYLAKTADTSLSGPDEEEDEEHLLALIQR
ncbi:hypothetical protein H0E87_025548 [Populus deltoides]|uniref:DUF4220 domain-containing protein n=1 Tax=Populus deltoides TaxID=3696 RepID=A0A8T2X0Q4_POPDE|nr:hypothetical protein H0E87_025548 [Populus deltoides]